jgi:O-antigen ligase
MEYLIYILIFAVNIFPFIFQKLDIWHAQGIGTQLLILIMLAWSFIEKPKNEEKRNIPLAIIIFWLGVLTWFICYKTQVTGKYEIQRFFPFFNFLCMVFLYRFIVQYLNRIKVIKVLIFLKWVIVATLLLSVLQRFGLAQSFQLFTPNNKFYNNIIVGFIGNGAHLAALLGMLAPVLFFRINRENILILILLFILITFFSGTGTNDVALSGILAGLVACGFVLFYRYRKAFYWVLGFLVLSGILMVLFIDKDRLGIIFIDNGRFGLWKYYWNLAWKFFPFGTGLGTVNMIFTKTEIPSARHVHLEFLQILFEAGIIGLVAVMYFVHDLAHKVTDSTGLIFKAVLLGFMVNCCFTYPMHLWLPATYATIAYGCLVVNEG